MRRKEEEHWRERGGGGRREREGGRYLKSLSPKRMITGVNTLLQGLQVIKCELLVPDFMGDGEEAGRGGDRRSRERKIGKKGGRNCE